MSKSVATVALSATAAAAFADGASPSVEVYAVAGGFAFSYSGTFSGHGLYAREFGATPYATVEAAVAAGLDVGGADGEPPVGAGADVGEFDGV